MLKILIVPHYIRMSYIVPVAGELAHVHRVHSCLWQSLNEDLEALQDLLQP